MVKRRRRQARGTTARRGRSRPPRHAQLRAHMYFRYSCDYGHEWIVFLPGTSRQESVQLCLHGHEAVTEVKEVPMREYYASLVPAEREIATTRGFRTICTDKYYVLVQWMIGERSVISLDPLPLADACDLLRMCLTNPESESSWISRFRPNP